MGLIELIRKYSTLGPRYTSYPTAPQWTDHVSESHYREQLHHKFADPSDELALYVHIPFCEQLCYYCGCNIQITKDHSRSTQYVNALLREIETTATLLGPRRTLSQLSWGGGTPTFLTVAEIEKLQKGITQYFKLTSDAEVSIEIDPRVTSEEQLCALREFGFNRASLGVQDFNEAVQKAVNRIQSAAMTETMLQKCHSLGFSGVNFDLIYGLPLQNLETFSATVDEVIRIRPDRIALYNYAHLPSLRPHQKILEQMPMPQAEERVEIFTLAYEKLLSAGYRSIGMDHFALQTDEMYASLLDGRLYRNFMGYTVKKGAALLGIGASAIGESSDSYFQNIREAKSYEEMIAQKGLATLRGCQLTQDDLERKWTIQSLMCQFKLDSRQFEDHFQKKFSEKFTWELTQLDGFFQEGILEGNTQFMRVTDLGRLFVRNVAMIFDAYLRQGNHKATYSKTV
ncbi:MAG: oxygen-independent coproporphyrinogen III oxidase [Proteobacteria bacterium]|nr:oxygen-independent coproporphyrinogen III oxidase [Pseudomonadota bacterium]NDC24426.1 oxygen-independent coproporphyrinogen III oxidase [Pseudomonadota bacterium]NDD04396.1 oxygen-independent coproporphyrinogen III oxidase [Pseudomonadota bacterium]